MKPISKKDNSHLHVHVNNKHIKQPVYHNLIKSGPSCSKVKMLLVNVSFELCFVCVEVLRPSQPNRVMSSAVSLPNHKFTGQA